MSVYRLVSLWMLFASIRADPLRDFQVAQPPPFPANAQVCTTELFQHSFGNSFGTPALASVTPPTDCGPIGSWAGITLNLTGTSVGRQFDRLAIVSFNGNEIWRSSTPEPTTGDGIIWTYIKDVTRFIPLFTEPGTLQLELDNLLDATRDGVYNVTFSISFIASSVTLTPALKADLIVPIANITSVSPTLQMNATFPINIVSAYAEIIASGNSQEEFWYNNAADKFFFDIPPNNTFPNGPFREVRLFIDSNLAGVVFPYAVYFTGADTPPAWRPITSYGALDQPSYVVDLTAFAPLLADGLSHNVSMDVVSLEANHTINQNWFISGLIHVFKDSSDLRTTGSITVMDAPLFADGNVSGSVGSNGDVNITVTASHNIHIEAMVVSGSGITTNVVWKQDLRYSNTQNYLQNVTIQNVKQSSSGAITATHNGVSVVSDAFQYPMEIDLSATTPDFINFDAKFDHSYDRTFLPGPFAVGTTIQNHQFATGTFNSTAHSGDGTNANTFSYTDTEGNTFTWEVSAVNNTITVDKKGGTLAESPLIPDSPHNTANGQANGQAPFARLPGGRTPNN